MEKTDWQREMKVRFELLAWVMKADGMDPNTFVTRAKNDLWFPSSEKRTYALETKITSRALALEWKKAWALIST